MIAFYGVSARRAPLALANVTLAWGPGVHAIIGAAADGARLLLALMAGAAFPRKGRIAILGGAPSDPRVRKRVAYVPVEVSLPDGLRVDEVLAIAADLRAEPARAASPRLAVLGLEVLARRPVRSLSRAEARGVALVEALTSHEVRAILIEEPLVAVDFRAGVRVADAIRAKAADGCAVVVATGSLRDASLLADDFVLMTKGGVTGTASSFAALAGFAPDSARLLIVTPDTASAHALIARLAQEADVGGIEHSPPARTSARDGAVVGIRGQNALVLAQAAARAALDAGVDLLQLSVEPPSLDEARAAAALSVAPDVASEAAPVPTPAEARPS